MGLVQGGVQRTHLLRGKGIRSQLLLHRVLIWLLASHRSLFDNIALYLSLGLLALTHRLTQQLLLLGSIVLTHLSDFLLTLLPVLLVTLSLRNHAQLHIVRWLSLSTSQHFITIESLIHYFVIGPRSIKVAVINIRVLGGEYSHEVSLPEELVLAFADVLSVSVRGSLAEGVC